MARASGRLRFNADTTSSPLPSPSRKSTTANAGAALPICARPSDTVSQAVTVKPRASMARASRSRNGLSSSTIRSERSARSASSAVPVKSGTPLSDIASYGVTTRRCQGLLKSLGGRLLSGFVGLEALARPGDLHHRTMIRKYPVGERDLCAGPLQQRAGDEHSKPEPLMLALGVSDVATPRQIGLADPLDEVGRNAGSVVGNDDLDGIVVPPRIHLHRGPRKIDGVFQDVADAIQNSRIARADRLGGARDRDANLDRDPEVAMRRHCLLDQGRQLHAIERRAGGR